MHSSEVTHEGPAVHRRQPVRRSTSSTVPSIADDEVLLASRSVGICHCDLELLAGRYIIPFEFPVIPGHEWSAEVVAGRLGRSTAWAVGDRVVGECVIGQDHFGFSISGAAAEFFVAKEAWLHRLPDNLSLDPGRARRAVQLRLLRDRARRQPRRERHRRRARRRADRARRRRRRRRQGRPGPRRRARRPRGPTCARALGAEDVLDPTADDVPRRGRRAHRRRAAPSVVFEASGKPAAMATALEVAGFRARLVYIGIDVGGSAPARLGPVPVQGAARRAASSARPASGRRPCGSCPAAGSTSSRWSPRRYALAEADEADRGRADGQDARSRSTSPPTPPSDATREPRHARSRPARAARPARRGPPRPRLPAPGEVVIEVTYNGLCGTDATEYTKGPMMVPLHVAAPGQRPRRPDHPRARVHRHRRRRRRRTRDDVARAPGRLRRRRLVRRRAPGAAAAAPTCARATTRSG